jgi:hypothetical protein
MSKVIGFSPREHRLAASPAAPREVDPEPTDEDLARWVIASGGLRRFLREQKQRPSATVEGPRFAIFGGQATW